MIYALVLCILVVYDFVPYNSWSTTWQSDSALTSWSADLVVCLVVL